MSRFLKDREYLTGRSATSQRLIDQPYPIDLPPGVYKGTWVVTEGGEMQWSNGEEWVPLAPPGTEMMIPPWVGVPEGWFEISGQLGGDFTNRRVIANKFDFSYLDNDLLSWMLPLPASMFETSAGLVQVAAPPAPVGLVLSGTAMPRVNWSQSVSGSRPTWSQVTRLAAGQNRTINKITFNRLGQACVLDIPIRTQGTMIVCTSQGIYALGVDIPQGAYTYGRWDHLPVEEVLLLSKFLTNSEIEAFKDFLVDTRFRVRDNFASVTDLRSAWRDRTEITSFPMIDTSNVTNMGFGSSTGAWLGCTKLQTFPALSMAKCLSVEASWQNCTSLQSFPAIAFPVCRDFRSAWQGCSSMLSFPALNMAVGWAGDNSALWYTWQGCTRLLTFPTGIVLPPVNSWAYAWQACTSLNNKQADNGWSFPLFDVSLVNSFNRTWNGCASFLNFPPINTGNGIDFFSAWENCAKINNIMNYGVPGGDPYSFPMIDTAKGENFFSAWRRCAALTSFPPLNFQSALGTVGIGSLHGFQLAWEGCSALTTFPAGVFNASRTNNYANAFTGCALTQTSVDNILTSVAASAATFNLNNGQIDINLGANASPSVATGRPAVDALRARGWVVNVVGYPA
ncbi:hypothetical protein [Sphingomonas radiodurans]|uniref:hypothetical protein n=1 Tax=Sphingomonas radiodurans TaxID=2890321 RepID=UPI001E389927|nr:hypothetical protein [Sphingomonas radiodurans]WBH17042.1 hypothetical protein LLW23_02670 [Sphingomonas radiodurans]